MTCGARKFWGDGWDAEGWLRYLAPKGKPLPEGRVINEAYCGLDLGHDGMHRAESDGWTIEWPDRPWVIAEWSD